MGADHVRAELLSDEVKLDQATNVIVFCTNPLNHERLLSLDHLCREKNIPWLLTRVTEECGVVGPYFEKMKQRPIMIIKKRLNQKKTMVRPTWIILKCGNTILRLKLLISLQDSHLRQRGRNI